MAKEIITTLHPEDNVEDSLFPNIKEENIPSSYTTKINNSINSAKAELSTALATEVDDRKRLISSTETNQISVGTSDYDLELVGVNTYARGGLRTNSINSFGDDDLHINSGSWINLDQDTIVHNIFELQTINETFTFNDNELLINDKPVALKEDVTTETTRATNAETTLQNNIDTKVSLTGNETISGTKTFSGKVEATTLNATNLTKGNKSVALAEDVDTLKKSVDSNWDLICSSEGQFKYSNKGLIYVDWTSKNKFTDPMLPYYTNFTGMFYCFSSEALIFTQDINADNKYEIFTGMFYNATISTLTFRNAYFKSRWGNQALLFGSSTINEIVIADGCKALFYGIMDHTFSYSKIKIVPAFDVSNVTQFWAIFELCTTIKEIHFKHIRVSLDIHFSTQFETDDLVEIISNLDEVTTAQTLTMGATNLAKLSDEQKQVATDKGWVLA